MNEQNSNDRHTEVWDAIDTLRSLQAESQKEISGLSGVVKQLIDEVKDLKGIIHRPQDKFNWVGFGALVVGVLMCAGAYTSAIITPIEKRGQTNSDMVIQRLMDLPDDYYTFGQNNARLEAHDKILEKLSDAVYALVKDTERNGAGVECANRWIQDVDIYGSRKHVISAAQKQGE